jgi:hypothetical protein
MLLPINCQRRGGVPVLQVLTALSAERVIVAANQDQEYQAPQLFVRPNVCPHLTSETSAAFQSLQYSTLNLMQNASDFTVTLPGLPRTKSASGQGRIWVRHPSFHASPPRLHSEIRHSNHDRCSHGCELDFDSLETDTLELIGLDIVKEWSRSPPPDSAHHSNKIFYH